MAWSSRFSFSTRQHLPVCSSFSHTALYPYSTGSYESTRIVNINSPPKQVRKNTDVTSECHAINRRLCDNILPHFLLITARRPAANSHPFLSRYKSYISICLLKVNVTANTLGAGAYNPLNIFARAQLD